MRLSARNQLRGTISSIDVGAIMATVTIRLQEGQDVVASITRESVETLELQVGDEATAVIKSTEVIVGKD